MEEFSLDLASARGLAEALAIGLLVGIERYKSRSDVEKGSAGVRTFAAFGLLGGVCGLLGQTAFTLAAFAAVAALIVVGYYRESEHAVGLTTEMSALVVFWLGVLVHTRETLAVAAAIVLALLLASKQALHQFVKDSVTERELFDTLKFLALVLVVYPLLPDRTLGPFGFFNPRRVWLLVILVAAIGYAGYLLVRFFGRRRGLILSAITGGVVSSTAATVALSGRARAHPESTRLFGVAAVLASAVQLPRLLLLAWFGDASFGRHLMMPLVSMSAAGLLGALVLSRRDRRHAEEESLDLPLTNPFSLTPTLKFACFFVAVLFLVRAAQAWLGDAGIYLASALGGTASASAVCLTLAGLTGKATFSHAEGATAMLLALSTNAISKWTLARVQGTRALALWLAGGLATMLAAGAAVLYLRGDLPF